MCRGISSWKNRRVSLKYSRGMRLWSSDGFDIGRDNGDSNLCVHAEESTYCSLWGEHTVAEWPLSNIYNALTVRGA